MACIRGKTSELLEEICVGICVLLFTTHMTSDKLIDHAKPHVHICKKTSVLDTNTEN